MFSRFPQGVAAILLAVFAMALTDVLIKLSRSGMVLWQIWILRSARDAARDAANCAGSGCGDGAFWVALRGLALVARNICAIAQRFR